MMRVKVLTLAVAAALALSFDATAGGPFHGSDCSGGRGGFLNGLGNQPCTTCAKRTGFGFFQPPFQAAPWYLYWPYDQHFQLPAPINAPYYAPHMYGHPGANTYFPQAGGYPGMHGGHGYMPPPVGPGAAVQR